MSLFPLPAKFVKLVLGLTFAFYHVNSQDINRRFRHYTTLEELSQNTVDCILRDKRGFMWFGTWGKQIKE